MSLDTRSAIAYDAGTLIRSTSGKVCTEMVPFALSSLKQCVAFLYREKFNNTGELEKDPVGTCFFIIEDTGWRQTYYLVTAKHVLADMRKGDGRMFGRVNRTSGDVYYVPLDDDGWVEHPNKNVNLVVYERFLLNLKREYPDFQVSLGALPLDVARSVKRYASEIMEPWPLPEAEQVFFMGLMLQYQGDDRNYPVVRMGHIALNTEEEIDLKPGKSRYRLIESLCYYGNSGSPVWAYYDYPGRETRWLFLGVLTLGFKSEADHFGQAVEYTFGISAVVPGEYLVEMIEDMEREKDRRRKEGDTGTPLSGPDAPLTRQEFGRILRQVSRPDGKEVIEKLDEASSGT